MKVQIKCPSCFFKFEGEIDKSKDGLSCVCPRCGTPFMYKLPIEQDKKENAGNDHEINKDATNQETSELSNLRVCKECGSSFDISLFCCPSCGCPIDGYSYCPDCNNLVSDKSKTCPNCGSPINGYTFCPDCDTLIAPGNSACPNCGCPIDIQAVPEVKSAFTQTGPANIVQERHDDIITKKLCPECHSPIDDKDTICSNCGSPVNGYFYCNECNQIVPPNAKECPNCGNPFSDNDNTQTEQYEKTNDESQTEQHENAIGEIRTGQYEEIHNSEQETQHQEPTPQKQDVETFPEYISDSNNEDFDKENNTGYANQESPEPISEVSSDEQDNEDKSIDNGDDNDRTDLTKQILPSDSEESDDNSHSKRKHVIIIIITGIVLILVMFFIFFKCSNHKTSQGGINDSDSVMVDSMKVIKGSVIPLWLAGQWTGTFTDKSMGKFTVLIIIDKTGRWTQMITPNGKRGESEIGKITSYTPKGFDVIYDSDKSKASFEVKENNKTFSLGKGFWLTKE